MSAATARPTTWLVTGANRGIGLEIVRQLLESPVNLVIATTRKPEASTALSDLAKTAKGTLHVLQLDIGDFDSTRALPKKLEPILGEPGSLDYLINNAATLVMDTAFTVAPEDFLNILRVNTVGPSLVSQVCLQFLEKGATKKILNVSSAGGSIATVAISESSHPFYLVTAYAASKSALNMLTYKQKLEKPDFTIITLCPGWVKTEMGGSSAELEPKDSVAGILKVITSATTADSGKYLRFNGDQIPW
ncbi:NAD-P-binding protein [Lenzites betulinus]|nr:NAD-P-binding protein [Lenzites betulinus]